MLKGVFDKRRFLDLIKDFIVFGDTGKRRDVKILAGYHQFHAVRQAVSARSRRPRPMATARSASIWHTQGSGKSLLMAFYAGQIIKHPAMAEPDARGADRPQRSRRPVVRHLQHVQGPAAADARNRPRIANDLRKLLDRPSGGVIFTTLQKFSPEDGETDYPVLTDRRNVIVIADEAHRSQYGFDAKLDRKTGEISYGFAKYLRDALPNASFIGFTGTPIEKDDVNTPAVFGDYIDIYDISRAVEDGATVPIYYESRLARIETRRGREAEDRRRDRRTDRGRGRRPSRNGSSANGRASRRWSAPKSASPCRRGPGEAFRGAHRGARRQGDDRLHEPPHLRRALRRHREAAARLAQRR